MFKVERGIRGTVPTYRISANGQQDSLTTEFLMQLEKQNRSYNTVEKYARSICYMLNYLLECDLSLCALGECSYNEQVDILHRFLLWVQEGKHKISRDCRPVKNGTINNYLRDFFRYYQFLVQYKGYKELQALRKKQVVYTNSVGLSRKGTITVFDYYLNETEDLPYIAPRITDEEEECILAALKNLRDIAIIRLLLDTGMRKGELLGIYQQDLCLEKGYVRIQFRPTNENGARAKRGENRKLFFGKTTQKALMEYMEAYNEILSGTPFLFVKLQGKGKGKAMNNGDVDSLMRRLKKKTGIPLHPHLLRHRCAEKRYESGNWRLFDISKLLGHKNIATTETYLRTAEYDCEEKQQEFFEFQDADLDITWLEE